MIYPRYSSASPFSCSSSVPGVLPPRIGLLLVPGICKAHSLASFNSLLKCQLVDDATANHPIEYYNPFPLPTLTNFFHYFIFLHCTHHILIPANI